MNRSINIQFNPVVPSFVQECFVEAWTAFPDLHTHQVRVRMRPLGNTTMQAQPVLDWQLWSREKRRFVIDLNNRISLSLPLKPQDLPRKVLVGWFAHELGHVADYQQRSVLSLLFYGLGYLLSARRRSAIEREADLYAIRAGMGDYILATKRFIVEHKEIPSSYKARIERYYLSIEEIALLLEKQDDEQLFH